MFITSKHVCGNESVSSAPSYLETCLTSPGRHLPWPPSSDGPGHTEPPGLPLASAGILGGLMGSRLSGAPSPPPRRCSRVLKVLFAQTQTELQPQRLVLSPRRFFSLSPYVQVPTPRSKETQTLYTHLLKLLLHGLLLRRLCFRDRLKGERLWVDQKPRAFV